MGRRRKANQFLKYPAALTSSSSGNNSTITVTSLGLPLNRPARPKHVEVEYYSPEPRAFNFVVYAGNGEEVYQSDTILSGPIPRRRTFVMPTSTDFATYQNIASSVVVFNHATNPSLRFVVNIGMEHKAIPIGTYF